MSAIEQRKIEMQERAALRAKRIADRDAKIAELVRDDVPAVLICERLGVSRTQISDAKRKAGLL